MKRLAAIMMVALSLVPVVARAQSPRSSNDYVRRGLTRSASGDIDGSLEDFEAAIHLDRRNAVAYINRGLAHFYKGDFDRAIADYMEAIRLDTRNAWAYHNRGVLLYYQGDTEGAIADASSAIRFNPRLNVAYVARASALYKKGEYAPAANDYAAAIPLISQDDSYYSRVGDELIRANLLNAAHRGYGLALQKLGDYAGAKTAYLKAARADTRSPDAYNDLAWLMSTCPQAAVRDGRLAVEYALRAGELGKWRHASYMGTLSAAYAEVGDFEEAIRWQRKALEDPQYVKNFGEGGRARIESYRQRKPWREP